MGNNLNIYIAADNIISSLGFTTRQNAEAIKTYCSGVKPDESHTVSNELIPVARISDDKLKSGVDKYGLHTCTKAEQLIILSINQLQEQYQLNLSSPSSALIISTTKGNIDTLRNATEKPDNSVFLWNITQKISDYYKLDKRVYLVSNACISGISALIIAKRLLQSGTYRSVVVTGVDVLSHFITSGFASLKSLSAGVCRPYDTRRDGLNLSEACGSMLLTTDYCPDKAILRGGAITNDANHISGPSHTGDGLYYAMQAAMDEARLNPLDIDYINLHGTATIYNDEMEDKAVYLARLQHVPINSLKPYLGHTLGASGIIETVLCIHQLKKGIVFGTLGYEKNGVSQPLNVSGIHRHLPLKTCVKTASGFGGCNAAIVLSMEAFKEDNRPSDEVKIRSVKRCIIENNSIVVDEAPVLQSAANDFAAFIREAYKVLGESNMKFYKMDDLSKLAYMAAAYLLKDRPLFNPLEIGIILANSVASLDTDIKHQQIIDEGGNGASSPAVFVYTLPNVAAGEICIRHKIQGENTFFIEQEYSPEKLKKYVQLAMQNSRLNYCICGWCDFLNGKYKADFELMAANKE
ncbi:MAG: beta-ACP synthase [Prevotellaceae bacterium]|jgi:3-oxoacyl-(acyl-carrier-protein) synthase|nr:beta-ACP synthase [Prevotellaceae bacterium]